MLEKESLKSTLNFFLRKSEALLVLLEKADTW